MSFNWSLSGIDSAQSQLFDVEKNITLPGGLKYLQKLELCEMWPLPARDGVCWGWDWIAGNPARDAKIPTYCCCNIRTKKFISSCCKLRFIKKKKKCLWKISMFNIIERFSYILLTRLEKSLFFCNCRDQISGELARKLTVKISRVFIFALLT